MIEPKIEDELSKITRRLDSIQKQLDLLNDDRNILETIQVRLTAVEEAVNLARQNDNAVRKDIKEEIGISNDKTVAAVQTEVQGLKSFVKNRGTDIKKVWWKWGKR